MGALGRFFLLLGLRYRLLINNFAGKPGRVLFAVVGFLALLGWGASSGFVTYRMFADYPDEWFTGVRVIFLAVFVLQVTFGVVFVATGDFFDTSRLLHLPVGTGEIFSAMLFSTVFHPATLMFAAPGLSFVALLSGPTPAVVARVAIVLLLVTLGQAIAMATSFALLALYNRRRLRDAATLLSSVAGLAAYLVVRGGAERQGEPLVALLKHPVWGYLTWFPTSWFGEVFMNPTLAGVRPALMAAGVATSVLGALWLGSRAFGRLYAAAGETGDRGDAIEDRGEGLFNRLPADIGQIARRSLSLIWREPQLKALLLQQHVFLLAPILLNGRGDGTVWFLIPVVIVFAHAWLALSIFGFDAGGLKLTLQSPIGRARLILGRLVAIAAILFAVDAVVTLVTIGILGAMRHDLADALPRWAAAYALTVVADSVLLSCGAVVSVLAPVSLLRSGKGRGLRVRQDGCAVAMGRTVALAPVLVLTGIVGAVAVIPRLFRLQAAWYLLTVPACVVLVAAVVVGCVTWAGQLLVRREERVLAALTDMGD